jgi:beta-galactosidase GanA
LELADIKSPLDSHPGVEVTERWQGEQRLLFVLNHNEVAQEIDLCEQYIDLLSGELLNRCASVAPRGVLILVAPP